ncbi:MAG: AAA family ATPase, partial [candidate division Zixibacteria bacterium]|nr:AAA family ATPase [candidate division Zixibacteria bacterium]
MSNSSAGGAAAAGGMNFQYRATAWVAVQILAEKDASPPWNLPVDTTLDWLRCETEQPVDDLMVSTSTEGVVFGQIKHTLNLTRSSDSDLASALDQFVRQFITHRTISAGTRPWERHLDPDRDRFVIITGPRSSKPIKEHLPVVLNRLHGLVQGQRLEDAAVNDKEQRVLSVVTGHIGRFWKAILGVDPSDEDIRQVLSLMRIQVLDVDDGGAAEREAKDRLRSAILQEHENADAAWQLLINLCAQFAQERSGADRIGLQQALFDGGIALRAVRSYRVDIERLTCYSQTITTLLADLARIRIGTTDVKIRRRSTEELRRVAEERSVLVIGEPGAGKSGALHDLAQMLADDGRDVVCLAVDRLAARSLGEVREELGLEHNLIEVLDNWPGTQPAFLVIDALDAARADPAAKAIRDMIRIVVEQHSRWRVVASVRKFDLRYSVELQQFFLGNPSAEFHDKEFANIRHVNIPQFTDEELAHIGAQSPAIQGIISGAPPELSELLRVPFNLRLIAELLGEGVDFEDLTPIGTQIELLNRYWTRRIIRSDEQGDARETVLRRTCNEMVKARTLHADRLSVA